MPSPSGGLGVGLMDQPQVADGGIHLGHSGTDHGELLLQEGLILLLESFKQRDLFSKLGREEAEAGCGPSLVPACLLEDSIDLDLKPGLLGLELLESVPFGGGYRRPFRLACGLPGSE